MFRGSIPALVTPMTSSGEVDENSYKGLLDFHIQSGTDGVVALGTTGESCVLTTQEKERLISITLEKLKAHNMPVMVGTGSNCTRATIENTKLASKQGADACLVVTPYYNRPTQQGLLSHFQAVADSATCPIYLYNVPTRTACDLLPETVAKLSSHPNIAGIKDATGNLERLSAMQELCMNDFIYLSGDDPSCFEFMQLGGQGVISVTSNIAPEWMQKLCTAVRVEDKETALSYHEKLKPLHAILGLEPNPIPVKFALWLMGLIDTGIRLPLTWLNTKHHMTLKDTLVEVGILEEELSHA